VWQGPPPADLAKYTGLLLDMCRKAAADTVVVDSLKDAAIGLNDDEVGAGWNRARQTAIAAGVEVVELHHQRKSAGGARASHPGIDDVYGSTWLTSGPR
jgi:replicative DNA helicase